MILVECGYLRLWTKDEGRLPRSSVVRLVKRSFVKNGERGDPLPRPITNRLPVGKLLRWAARNLRDLPWRAAPRDPYRVWISEIMLQQTQAATVIPYFWRFTERFPTVQALAQAPLDDVLKLWEGLGYYARARNLHRAAHKVVAEFGGQLPDTVEELSRLPGIGRYTAGAIASLAFGRDAPVVDGNVKRVLCRLDAIRGDVRQPKIQNLLWNLAEANLPKGKAGRWNEAMMELGATICTPRSPQCNACPLAQVCRARALGVQDKLPARAASQRTPHYDVTAAVIRKRGRVLIAQRPLGGMLGGLWEFPGGKKKRGESLEECLRREIREELGVVIEVGQRVTQVQHAYTHFRITLHAFECRHVRGRPRALQVADWRWVTLDGLDLFAFAVTDRKIIKALRAM
jgi:A/G-specific adenine glycosylase